MTEITSAMIDEKGIGDLLRAVHANKCGCPKDQYVTIGNLSPKCAQLRRDIWCALYDLLEVKDGRRY